MAAGSIEIPASQVPERALAVAVGIICVALLGTWIPHYLTWPWFRDVDAFATIAQSWGAGILPYRDISGYNFPGQIYLLWVLGKTVGWGHTAVFYAVDAALLLALGAALTVWSRRRLGGALPGLVSYLAFVAHYLSLDYAQVAQRDWEATFLIVLSLVSLQSVPSRAGRVTSALLAACASAFRPHVVLFLPALWSGVDESVHAEPRPRTHSVRALAEWSLVFGVGLVTVFAPLMAAGVFWDFVRGLSVALYGGPYSTHSPGQALQALIQQLGMRWTLVGLSIGPLVWIFGPAEWRRLSRTWCLAMIGALLYKPLHPVQHDYLLRPIELMSAVNVALLVAWLLASPAIARPIRLLALTVIIWASLPAIPRYCSIAETRRALSLAFVGGALERAPLGARDWLDAETQFRGYRWSDYRDVLTYLRTRTETGVVVANLLRRFPFPPVNGPTGRLSPFMVESGICWMFLVNQDLDADFAESLHRAAESIVVWSPEEMGIEPRMRLPRVVEVVRREYELDTRFGQIEIWKRRDHFRAKEIAHR